MTPHKQDVLDNLDPHQFWRRELGDFRINKDDEASACCPFHDDRNPSFTVNLSTNLWTCHAGCGGGDIFQFVQKRYGLDFAQAVIKIAADMGLQSDGGNETRRIIRAYQYTDEAGRAAFKLRWNIGKRFEWALDREGKKLGKGNCRPLLYQLESVRHFSDVFLVEGEHDVESVNRVIMDGRITGLMATCTPHGANNISPEFLVPLHGKARVWVSGDNDEAGRKYKNEIASLLRGHVDELFLLDVPPDYKDWAEWIEQGGTAEAFQALLKGAVRVPQFPWLASTDLVSGPPIETRWLIPGILPTGTVILMSGREGSMKSWIALDWAVTLSNGKPWLGKETQAGTALYLDAEMPLELFTQRVRGVGASPRLNVMSWQGDEFPTSLDSPILVQAAGCHDLIVVDTLRRFMGKRKEMSCDDMAEITYALKQLTRKGAAVLVLHHAVKDVERKGYRGSTELGAGCDVVLHVEKWDQDNTRKIKISTQKTRYPQETELVLMTRKDLPAPVFEEKSVEALRAAKLIELHQLIAGHEAKHGCAPNQSAVVDLARHLGGRQAVLDLLKAGEQLYWRSTLRGHQRAYHALSMCPSVSISNTEIDTEEGGKRMAEILSTETDGIGKDN